MFPLQPAFQSYSVPTSPAVSRSSKNYPVTPQRAPRQQQRHTQSFYRSPLTPSTPYSPLGLRSSDSTNSSILTTPDSLSLNLKRRIAFAPGSPEILRASSSSQDKSFADVAPNWRSRANENGIRVTSNNRQHAEDTHFSEDEVTDLSMSDTGNDSSILSAEALLPPFPSRAPQHAPGIGRPRTQSHSYLPPRSQTFSPNVRRNNERMIMPESPIRARQSQNQPISLLSTPPPNRNLVNQLKLKGSSTDPAHTRRREAFGVIRTAQNMNTSLNLGYSNDISMELFNIDEHEYEQDVNYEIPREDESFSLNLQAHQANTFGYLNYSYPTFPQYNNSDPFQTNSAPLGYGNLNLTESVEHHFHSLQQQQNANRFNHQPQLPRAHREARKPNTSSSAYVKPTHVPIPLGNSSLPIIQKSTILPPPRHANSLTLPPPPPQVLSTPAIATDCSVCLVENPSSLAILKPCDHPLCSTCLTSALNIVGEKDMECAVCKQGVQDFKLVVNSKGRSDTSGARKESTHKGQSFLEPNFSSPDSSVLVDEIQSLNECFSDLESGFEFGVDFSPGEIRASTPKLESSLMLEDDFSVSTPVKREPTKPVGNVILRIDNVPWDITPSQVSSWLQQPIERVYVLLDDKGKTMSHAYVEIRDQRIAGAILRSEAATPDGRKKERGSVLGKGRRARGVTITRSSQEELMADLFPHWRGAFDGSRPSLAGLQGDQIIEALEGGLLTEHEVTGLLYLIREPDSHFLKVPSLPFHSLVNILSKFPSDIDSRVFWSSSVRDMLFDVAYAAVEVLLTRLDSLRDEPSTRAKNDPGYSMELVVDLVQTVLRCQAFTSQQIAKLASFAKSKSIPIHYVYSSANDLLQNDVLARVMKNTDGQSEEYFGKIAEEFGVEAELVQALAQRLANLS